MKLFKSIYRYAIAGVLLAAAIVWTIYCGTQVSQLKAFSKSTAFIDMALNSSREADQLLLQLKQFKHLLTTGIIAIVVMVLVIGVMVAWQILTKRWEKEGKNPFAKLIPAHKPKAAAPVAAETVPQGGFCPSCGTPCQKMEGFCTQCGTALTEK